MKNDECFYDVGVIATHISPSKGYGGVANSAERLTFSWLFNDKALKVALVSSDASIGDTLKTKQVLAKTSASIFLYKAYIFKRWGFGFGAIDNLLMLCKRSKCIYIHGVATWPTTLGAIFCLIFGKPLIIAPRGGLLEEHIAHIKKFKLFKWLYYLCLTIPSLKLANAIHCTGELEKSALVQLFGIDAKKIFVIPNGINLDQDITFLKIEPKSKLRLCYVGRISREKGINSFLTAWLEIARKDDLINVAGSGRDGDRYFEIFKEIISKSEGRIVFLGQIEQGAVKKLIKSSHFLVLPSGLDGDIRENFGNVVIEAFALSRPVIVCRGLEWNSIEIQGAGFLFDRNIQSVKSTIKVITKLNKHEWNLLSKSARRIAEFNFDINFLGKKVLEFISPFYLNR